MKLKNILDLINSIHIEYGTSKPYLCGGLPRDKYLNRVSSISDIDITTGDKTIKELCDQSYNALNKSFNIIKDTKVDGHSSIYFKNMKIDFSSNYIDPYAEKYLINIGKNITPLMLESFSRDFTCNSMLISFDLKEITDPTERGKKDCDKKLIKTILPPEITFKKNPKTNNNNRIIRAIYLASKLDFTIDQSIVDYVTKNPALITLSSPKALAKKLDKWSRVQNV
jgi:tRNA nucleotidyltransferase/poly(A) polymerase